MTVDTRDEDSGAQALRRYVLPEVDLLYRVALRLTRNPHDAEDVVQETLLRAYRSIDRFDGRYPRAWLLTILRNTNVDRVRRRTPDLLHDGDRTLLTIPASGADGRSGPEELVLSQIADERVVEAVRRLSGSHRAVVALVDIHGLCHREAAEVLDVPVGTVMSRLHRARRKLRTRLERTGYLDEVMTPPTRPPGRPKKEP